MESTKYFFVHKKFAWLPPELYPSLFKYYLRTVLVEIFQAEAKIWAKLSDGSLITFDWRKDLCIQQFPSNLPRSQKSRILYFARQDVVTRCNFGVFDWFLVRSRLSNLLTPSYVFVLEFLLIWQEEKKN